jgi:hypothetical protein
VKPGHDEKTVALAKLSAWSFVQGCTIQVDGKTCPGANVVRLACDVEFHCDSPARLGDIGLTTDNKGHSRSEGF